MSRNGLRNGGVTKLSTLGRAHLRWTLGVGQMSAALLSFALLIRDGFSPRSLGSVATASILTTISVLLFGSQRARTNGEKDSG
jgi:hypothetical protein